MKIRHLVCALALLPIASQAAEPAANMQNAVNPLVRINDFDLTNMHFSVFAANRDAPAETAEQQVRLLNELVNTFMVAHSEQGRRLAADPEMKAAMEVANARLLAQSVINDAFEQIEISDQEVEKVFLEQYAEEGGQEYKARHILLETEEEAAAVIEALDEGGDFEQLAREKSTGPSGPDGGDLGWFTAKSMVKPFADAVMALEDGAYSRAAVETGFGWHVIMREATREVPSPKLEQVYEEIVDKLKAAGLAEFIRDLRKQAVIEVIQTEKGSAE